MRASVSIRPVTVDDFRGMHVDFSDHLDHELSDYWALVVSVAVTAGLFIGGKLYLIVGMIPDGAGICTAFVIVDDELKNSFHAKRCILAYCNTTMNLLQRLCNNPHRLQAVVCAANKTHIRFIEHMGFSYEGCLKGYTPSGQNAFIYGRRGGE